MSKKEIKKNILDLKFLVILSLIFTFMTYNISNYPYSETWLEYLAYASTAIVYLFLIVAIIYKISQKKNNSQRFDKLN
jgi:Na+/alanine symporter